MNNPTVLWIRLVSAVALMCLFANQGNAQWTGPVQNDLTIVGGWLFDGTTSELRTNPGIVIRNGRIVAVGSLSEMCRPGQGRRSPLHRHYFPGQWCDFDLDRR